MLRVGVLGTGFVGSTHAAAYKKLSDVELVSIADVNEETGRALADKLGCAFYKDAEEMIVNEKLDIVDVCLPTYLHEKYVLYSFSHGAHVICEKPFTLKLDEAQRMVEAAEEAGLTFMIAQVVRFWPEYVRAKEFYDKGIFGPIKMVYANRLAQHPNWSTWHRDVKKSGGGLFDLHVHDVDYMCSLFGEVSSVYAIGDKDENNCWNHVLSSLTFTNGSKAAVEGAFEMTDNYPFTSELRIVGKQAAYDYKFSAGFNLENVDAAKRSAVLYRNDGDPEVQEVDEYDAYAEELRYFVECVSQGKPTEKAPPRHSLDVLKVMLAIEKSLETGEKVSLK